MSLKYLPVYYLGHLVDTLVQHDDTASAWLESIGLTPEQRINARISTQELDKLLQHAFNRHNFESLGMEFGKRLQIAHHGAFGLAILNAPTVRDIIYFVQQYIVIRLPYIELSIVEESDELVILLHDHHWGGKAHKFVIEAVSMAMLNLFYALKQRNNDLNISRLFFDYEPPDYLPKYDVFSPAKLLFNYAFCGMTLDKKWLDVKLEGSDVTSFNQAIELCDEEKTKQYSIMTTSGQVRQIILNLQETFPSLDAVANELAMSTRTLHRELKREDTSFKKITDQVHAKKAKQYLLAHNLPVQIVAVKLGYSDTANFRRAFRRWFNCSPSEYRQRINDD